MKNKKIYRHRGAYAVFAAATAVSSLMSSSLVYAISLTNATQSFRNQVISTLGISSTDNLESTVTRADFAKMMVQASEWKDTVSAVNTVAAATDVPASYENAAYIRTALRNGIMRTKLGGKFAPSEAVTLNDAVKACLSLLGYTDDDFGASATEEKLSLFRSLDLDEGVTAKNSYDTLTKTDCINIIYDLLKTNTKGSSSIYGTVLGVTLSSDGEVNATSISEENMTGPILVKSYSRLKEILPFDMSEARLYYNGTDAGNYFAAERYYSSQISREGWLIVYYDEASKTVWAYGVDDGSSNLPYFCVAGKLNAVYYDSSNIVSPSSVLIGNTEYELSGSDVKFMFSINGDIRVGDEVVLICQENISQSSDGTEDYTYYCVGVVKYTESATGSATGTSLPVNAGKYNANTGTSVDSFGNVSEAGDK